jgi:hypothetical protein
MTGALDQLKVFTVVDGDIQHQRGESMTARQLFSERIGILRLTIAFAKVRDVRKSEQVKRLRTPPFSKGTKAFVDIPKSLF